MPELNPDFALQSRLSFGRRGVYAWAVVAGALILGFRGLMENVGVGFGLTQAGAFLLLAALPYGAIQVRALERRGQMDARRLTGLPPLTLCLALVGGSAWALLVAGVVLLAAGAAAGHGYPAFTLLALVALSAAMSLIVVLLPPSATVDSWVLLVLLFAGAVGTVNVMGADRAVALGVIIVSAIVVPSALPIAVRRMLQGNPHQTAGHTRTLLGRFLDLGSTSRPEFVKGLLSAGGSFEVATVMAVAGTFAIVWVTRQYDADRRDIFQALVVYGPLVLAGYDAAARVHRERVTGALDRVGLSGHPAWRVVVESAVAYSLPFVAVSIACAAALVVADRDNAALVLAHWPVKAGILIFWPLFGAFRGRTTGLYIIASIVMAAALGREDAPWIPGVLVVVTAVAGAALALERAGGAPANVPTIVAGAATIAAAASAAAGPDWNGLAVACVLSLTAGLLVPDRTRISGRAIVAGAAAAAVAAGLAEYYWTYGFFPVPDSVFKALRVSHGYPYRATRIVYAGIVALYAAAGFVFGCCVWNRFLGRPVASLLSRAIPPIGGVLLLLALDTHSVFFALLDFIGDYSSGWGSLVDLIELLALACLGAAAAVLGWRERAATIRERTPRF